MRVLITGGDGFIGRHLTAALLERGDNVYVIDNHITSSPSIEHSRLTRIEADVCDLNRVIPNWEADVIVHLASVAIPKLYMENPQTVISPNVLGTMRVCEYAERCGARVIFSSTSEVYGSLLDEEPIGTPLSESDPSLSGMLTPRSPYSISKKMGEEIVSDYIRRGFSGCSVRLFNVIGPQMDSEVSGYGRVVPNFMAALGESTPLPIYGDGNQTRSFLWIGDAIDALVKLINIEDPIPVVINIGNPEPVTISSLAKRFQIATNKTVGVTFLPRLPHEPRHRCPDVSLAESFLNWAPKLSLEDIIRMIVKEDAAL
tara:strand:- start:2814 stop:3758 length:945 start_codon:yes stop_codon:yes gene_type:complete